MILRILSRVATLSVPVITLIATCVSAQEPTYLGKISGELGCGEGHGRTIVPIGDQNGDGFDDILSYACMGRVVVHYGGLPIDPSEHYAWESVFPNLRQFGDVNNDGGGDLGLARFAAKRVEVYYGGSFLDTIRDEWYGLDTLYGWGNVQLTQDLNANGNRELVTLSNRQYSVLLYELDAAADSVHDMEFFPTNLQHNQYSFGHRLILGDYNGDGQQDLVISLRPVETSDKGALYCYWGGPTFDTIPELIIPRPGEWCEGQYNFGNILEHLGDINGDTYDDLFASSAMSADDTLSLVFYGGPGIDTIPDLTITDDALVARQAGDVNNDGENDFLTSYPFPSSSSGAVRLYLGGSSVDAVADWELRNSDMPDFQEYFGMEVAGVGDYTGDGIDDFAFTARGLSLNGEIYLFSGWDGSTEVGGDSEDYLPGNYVLSQNYPNPFNPSTTIEFALPTRSHVELAVHDVLGRKVATVIDRELSAGTHSVTWAGVSDDGKGVSSGVYFVRLTSELGVLSRKMVVLK